VKFNVVKKQQVFSSIGKFFHFISLLAFLLGLTAKIDSVYAKPNTNPMDMSTPTRHMIYLPIIRNGSYSELPLMAGVAPEGWPEQSTIENIMTPLDNWVTGVTGGRATSIFATFMPLNLKSDEIARLNVEVPLNVIWNAGYTPFVNLPALPNDTAYDIASGKYDGMITTWAKSFKNYSSGGTRFAYIAPLQEMNGEWVAYGGNPENFILAYKRFQTIFTQVGVPRKSVKWVFAPNGWTRPGLPLFEAYYPGNEFVDVVAISAYNFGYCATGSVWEEPETVFNNPDIHNGKYLDRLRALAPSKPIFIAQTGVSSYRYSNATNDAEKNRWLMAAYKYLSTQQNVRAVIYFSINDIYWPKCNWPIYTKDGTKYDGYRAGVNSNGFTYISPASLMAKDHTIR
jgi:hypothetical protein